MGSRQRLIVLALLFAGSGCASTSSVEESDMGVDEMTEPVVLSDYESFDVSPYRDRPIQIETTVEHEVPASLMDSSADDGIIEEVDGFRVQVFSGMDQQEAVSVQEALRSRLATLSDNNLEELGITRDIETYNLFIQPYYRVRVGDFTQHASARALADWLSRRFPGSFIVPDRVTIRR